MSKIKKIYSRTGVQEKYSCEGGEIGLKLSADGWYHHESCTLILLLRAIPYIKSELCSIVTDECDLKAIQLEHDGRHFTKHVRAHCDYEWQSVHMIHDEVTEFGSMFLRGLRESLLAFNSTELLRRSRKDEHDPSILPEHY